jgi:hypothetical protein
MVALQNHTPSRISWCCSNALVLLPMHAEVETRMNNCRKKLVLQLVLLLLPACQKTEARMSWRGNYGCRYRH